MFIIRFGSRVGLLRDGLGSECRSFVTGSAIAGGWIVIAGGFGGFVRGGGFIAGFIAFFMLITFTCSIKVPKMPFYTIIKPAQLFIQ